MGTFLGIWCPSEAVNETLPYQKATFDAIKVDTVLSVIFGLRLEPVRYSLLRKRNMKPTTSEANQDWRMKGSLC